MLRQIHVYKFWDTKCQWHIYCFQTKEKSILIINEEFLFSENVIVQISLSSTSCIAIFSFVLIFVAFKTISLIMHAINNEHNKYMQNLSHCKPRNYWRPFIFAIFAFMRISLNLIDTKWGFLYNNNTIFMYGLKVKI